MFIHKCAALISRNIIGISFGNGQNKHNSYDYDITTDKQRCRVRVALGCKEGRVEKIKEKRFHHMKCHYLRKEKIKISHKQKKTIRPFYKKKITKLFKFCAYCVIVFGNRY